MISKNQSLPDILKLRTFSTRSISIQKNGEQRKKEKQDESIPTPVFKYVLHEPKERAFLLKIFKDNVKKREIERNIQRYKNDAELNGYQLKQSQKLRFNLYLQQKDDSPQLYLSSPVKSQNETMSPINRHSPSIRASTKNSIYFSSTATNIFSPPKKIIKPPRTPINVIRNKQVNELIGKTKLFTIVYKSNILKKE